MNIIELAKEAGLALTDHGHPEGYAVFCERLERFAALVRAEALAEPVKQEPVCIDWDTKTDEPIMGYAASVDAKAILEMRDKAFQSYVDQAKADRELSVLQARLEALEEAAKWCDDEYQKSMNPWLIDYAAAIRGLK